MKDDKKIKGQEAVEQDAHVQEGYDEYRRIEIQANEKAEKLATQLVNEIISVNNGEKFNMSLAILSVAKALTHLASYLYDTEEEFLEDVKQARTAIPTDVIPALLRPEPCGKCEACRDDRPEDCETPQVRASYTTSRFLPILADMLLEYDLFNKVLWMYTVGREEGQEEMTEAKEEKSE